MDKDKDWVRFAGKKIDSLNSVKVVDSENFFDVAEALYWFAIDWHGGQDSLLYSILSTSTFKPSPLSNGLVFLFAFKI